MILDGEQVVEGVSKNFVKVGKRSVYITYTFIFISHFMFIIFHLITINLCEGQQLCISAID